MNERLRIFRKKIGMSQVEFAKALDVTQANISLLERSIDREPLEGKIAKPSGKLIEKIAETFPSLSMNWLFYNKGPIILSEKEHTISSGDEKKMAEMMSLYIQRLEEYKDIVDSLKKDKDELIQDKKELRETIEMLKKELDS